MISRRKTVAKLRSAKTQQSIRPVLYCSILSVKFSHSTIQNKDAIYRRKYSKLKMETVIAYSEQGHYRNDLLTKYI